MPSCLWVNCVSFLSISANVQFGSYRHGIGEGDLLPSYYQWASADRIVICSVMLDLHFISECLGCIYVSKYLFFYLGWLQQLVICEKSICAPICQVLGLKFSIVWKRAGPRQRWSELSESLRFEWRNGLYDFVEIALCEDCFFREPKCYC